MVAGAGLYAFLMLQPFACWLMLVGAIAFVLVQARQRYLGTQLVVRRLRRIMALAGWGFILAGLFMVEDCYHFLRPLFSGSLDGYGGGTAGRASRTRVLADSTTSCRLHEFL